MRLRVIKLGERIPIGLSRSYRGGFLFRIVLPFRWRDYCYYRDEETWGNLNFVLRTNHGFKFFWNAD